jgi:TRAP-type C4-dicarboxylate transport system permease small subunit
MRALLDRVYAATLWASGLCLIAIGLMVLAQILGRLLDAALKLAGMKPAGFVILSLSEIAGYLLAAASFLALAGTLRAGAHIRVTMLLGALGESTRRWLEVAAFGAAAVFSAWMTWYIGALAWDSWRNNEISPGLIPVRLVWPQAAMAVGSLALTVALIDELAAVLHSGRPTFRTAEDAITLGKEG